VSKTQIGFTKVLRRNILLIPVILFSVIAVSCSLFHNFTTYFNVVYLAQQHLNIYEEGLLTAQTASSGAAAAITTHQWLDEEYLARQLYRSKTGVAMPYALLTKNSAGASSSSKTVTSVHLDSAIILGSKVLADKKETKYVEDALFIVGKAQYYKGDFSGAKRKFNELLFRYPDTKYGTEVGMLMMRSLMSSNEFDTAATALGKVLKKAEGTGNTAQISEGQKAYAELILASSPDSLSAAAEHLRLAEQGLSADAASRLSYERGTLYFLDGKWFEAETAFRETIDRTPDAALQGEAMVALAEAMRREKKYSDAKQMLQGVLQKARFANSHPPAQYEYAYTVDLEARDAVGGDLKSSTYQTDYYPAVKGTYFILDTLYRTVSQAIMARSRFRQAEIFRGMGLYDSAAHIANIILGTKDFSTSEMNDYVNDRIRALTRFAEWKYQLQRIDTIEHILTKMRRPTSTMAEGVSKELRSEAEQKVLGNRWTADKTPTLTAEEEKLVVQYEEKIRREKAVANISAFSIDFSDTAKYIDSVHFIGAHAHFELGRAYENFVEYPSAISEYQLSLGYNFNHPDTAINNFRAQVLFAWVELDHQLGDATQRDSLIGILTKNYGETVYAQQAGKEYAGIRDKDSPGEVAFRSAYATLKSSGLEASKPAFLTIVNDHKHEDVAARSLYTIGTWYEDKPRYDSAVFYYRRVVTEYPYSKYAEYLKPRIQYALRDTAPKSAPHVDNTITTNAATSQSQPAMQNMRTLQDTVKNNNQKIQNLPVNTPTPPHKK